MLINLRNALMSGGRLPYDAEVEYLESTGTQWIDTAVKKTSGTTIDCTFSLSNTSSKAIFGARTSASSLDRLMLMTIGTYFRFDARFQQRIGLPDTTSTFRFSFDGANATLTNLTTGTTDTAATTVGDAGSLNIALFGVNTGGTISNLLQGRIYSFKLYNNGVLVRDFIPVRKGTVGYLYDRVSGKLFGNAGTGDFVLGQDVVPVEYIESHGTEWIDTGVNLASGDVSSISVDGQFTNNTKNEQFNGIYAGFYFGAVNYPSTGPKWGVGGTNVGTSDMSRHTFTLTGEIGASKTIRLAVDGNTFTNTRNVAAGKIGLFNIQGQDYYSYMKIWGSSISVNDTPVRKYRPVRVGTEGAMMDVLTRRIYRNQGTGAFTYGNDLKYPIPAE